MPEDWLAETARLSVKVHELQQKMKDLRGRRAQVRSAPDGQVSLTDPDARAMTTHSNTGTAMVGYNVQAAVDTKYHLVVAHEVTNAGHDRAQLSKMAFAAREAMGTMRLKAIADRGYFNSLEIKACSDAGVKAYVPKPMTSNAKAEGRFSKADLVYIARDDEYRCPAGQRAIYRYTRDEDGLQIRRYWTSACPECPTKARCTTGDYRRISRWEHEDALDEMQRRLDRQPGWVGPTS